MLQLLHRRQGGEGLKGTRTKALWGGWWEMENCVYVSPGDAGHAAIPLLAGFVLSPLRVLREACVEGFRER